MIFEPVEIFLDVCTAALATGSLFVALRTAGAQKPTESAIQRPTTTDTIPEKPSKYR